MNNNRLHSSRVSQVLSKITPYRLGAFLIVCLTFGGTNQDIVAPKMPIYLISLGLIAWSLTAIRRDSKIWRMKAVLFFIGLFVVMGGVSLIPLPPAIWTGLPGRGMLQQGFELLGQDLPWLPLSLTPEKTLFSLFDLLPVCAVALVMGSLANTREIKIAVWSIVGFAGFSVVIEMLQISGVSAELDFYIKTAHKSTLGFFSNANHQSSLLLMAIPFAFGMAARAKKLIAKGRAESRAPIMAGMVSAIILCIGILLGGSIAGYILLIPVLLGSIYLYFGHKREQRLFWLLVPCLLISAIVFDFIFLGNHLQEFVSEFTNADQGTRPVMFAKTYEAIIDYFPFGTGANSFRDVYEMYQLSGIYTIPHAHNDYLEIVLEYGIVGLVGLITGLIWWGRRLIGIFKSRDLWAKSASIASFSIIVHSLADYPLRTISLAVVFVFCLCLMTGIGKRADG